MHLNGRTLLRRSALKEKLRKAHGLVPNEPKGPRIVTPVPGPNTLKHKKQLMQVFNAGRTRLVVDYEKSLGNYLVDADGNTFLDLFPQLGSLPLGYNFPSLLNIFKKKENMKILINRPSCGKFPGGYWAEKLSNVLLSVAPPNMKHVTPMMCGSCAIESTLKVMFIGYKKRERGNDNFTELEMTSSVNNKPPGSPNFVVLSLSKSYHGSTTGASTISHAYIMSKVGTVTKEWPIASVPLYKHPLEKNAPENDMTNKKSLAEAADLIKKYNDKGETVVGIIVETIQERGNNILTTSFIKDLQKLAKQNKCYFAIDEVSTGCGATGKMWDVENLNLEEPPDILTFGSKMQFGGYYRNSQLMSTPTRIFNTWMGDPGRLLVLEEILKVVKESNLLQKVTFTGKMLLEDLNKIQKQFPHIISHVTGRGTLVGIICTKPELTQTLLVELEKRGVLCGKSGVATIILRPTLILEQYHAGIFLEIFMKILKELK